jgi:arylsulfatase A-like enzyme
MFRNPICFALPLLILIASCADPAPPQATKRPNIILIMTDDQGYGDLGCHGHPWLKTPHLDTLYSQSTRFTDFHVSPTCAPTRGALMAGRYPFKLGISHTILERERMALGVPTIADVLRDSGYRTGIFGKWHLGDEDAYQPEKRGFDEVFIHGAGGIGQNYPGTQGAVPGTSYFDPIIKHNGTFVQTTGFCTDVFFHQALRWIKSCQDAGKPFFAYIPTNAPHGPFIATEEDKARVAQHVNSEEHAGFFGMIVNIDDNVGRLMEKLEQWNLSEDTLLIFMTDNGSARGSQIFNAGMKGAKASVHEGGARVPLFMRWPGQFQAGVDIDRLARHIDIFPTLAEIAGADPPNGLDGRSLLPLIKDPGATWPDRKTFFHKGRWKKAGAPNRWGKGNTDPDQAKYQDFAVRNERWRLVGKDELYDINEDPGEQTNVIAGHPDVARDMLAAYEDWWNEVRPLLVNEDAPLDTGKPFIEQFNKQKESQGLPTWDPGPL